MRILVFLCFAAAVAYSEYDDERGKNGYWRYFSDILNRHQKKPLSDDREEYESKDKPLDYYNQDSGRYDKYTSDDGIPSDNNYGIDVSDNSDFSDNSYDIFNIGNDEDVQDIDFIQSESNDNRRSRRRRRRRRRRRTASTGSSMRSSNEVEAECLSVHNAKRRLHQDTPLMTYDSALAQGAQAFASKLAKTGGFFHDNGNFGENIFSASSSARLNINGQTARASNSWYSEIKNYSFSNSNSKNGGKIGHFTQMVWDRSIRLGCGAALSKDGKRVVVVARYYPPGNYKGRYGEHVHSLK